MDPLALLLADSRFPSGSYAHSLGPRAGGRRRPDRRPGVHPRPPAPGGRGRRPLRRRGPPRATGIRADPGTRCAGWTRVGARGRRARCCATPRGGSGAQLLRSAATCGLATIARYRVIDGTPRPIALGVVARGRGRVRRGHGAARALRRRGDGRVRGAEAAAARPRRDRALARRAGAGDGARRARRSPPTTARCPRPPRSRSSSPPPSTSNRGSVSLPVERALRIGVGGPVGSGKSSLIAALCGALAAEARLGVVTNDIYTTEDAEFLRSHGRAAGRADRRGPDRRLPAHRDPRRHLGQPRGGRGARGGDRAAGRRLRRERRRQPDRDLLARAGRRADLRDRRRRPATTSRARAAPASPAPTCWRSTRPTSRRTSAPTSTRMVARGVRAPRRPAGRRDLAARRRHARSPSGSAASSRRSATTATCTRAWKACPITTTITSTEAGFTTLRRGERIAPRVLAPGRITLLRSQAGPLAGDHDRVEIVVESGTLTVEPIAATVALPGPRRTVLELDVTVGDGAHLVLEDAPLVVAEGADVRAHDDDPARRRARPRSCATSSSSAAPARAAGGSSRVLRVEGPDGVILHDALRIEPGADDAYVALAPGHRAVGTLVSTAATRELAARGARGRRLPAPRERR